jgi:hypothetical protein
MFFSEYGGKVISHRTFDKSSCWSQTSQSRQRFTFYNVAGNRQECSFATCCGAIVARPNGRLSAAATRTNFRLARHHVPGSFEEPLLICNLCRADCLAGLFVQNINEHRTLHMPVFLKLFSVEEPLK